jgi:hypothetical protein
LAREFTRRWVEVCREKGIQTVWLLLPEGVGDDLPAGDADALLRMAQETGLRVVDLMDVFGGYDASTLRVDELDRHPNERGHQLIADRLYQLLRENPDGLFPGFSTDNQQVRK